METAFISYRRQDSAGYSRALYNELAQHFDAAQIFMDVDDIPLGATGKILKTKLREQFSDYTLPTA